MATSQQNRTYYDVLHVSRDAPRAIIRGSYRTMMQHLKCHPDLGGDTETASLINKAYAVLNNPVRRAAYDAQLDVLSRVGTAFTDEETVKESTATASETPNPIPACLFCDQPHQHGNVVQEDATCANCGSPLYAAQDNRLESGGKRAIERLQKAKGLRFFTQWPQRDGYAGQTRDISLNGLRFITPHPLQEGQRIKIVSRVLEAIAVVTHCSEERHNWSTRRVVGVSFMTLRFVRSIGGFVSEQV